MITEGSYRSRDVWLMPAVLMALFAALQLGGEPLRLALRYDHGLIAQGEWWRLLTGSFVHLSAWHLFLNELGIVVLVLLAPERLSPAVWLRRVLCLDLGMAAGMFWLAPHVQWYVGMSGVIHGLFVLALGRQVVQQRDLIALGCLVFLLGKLAWEMFAGAPVSDEAAIGGSVVLESHLYGSLSALIYGVVFHSFTRIEGFRNRVMA